MRKNNEAKNVSRKAWIAPALVVLSAGSAEAGQGTIGDGGGPGNSRS